MSVHQSQPTGSTEPFFDSAVLIAETAMLGKEHARSNAAIIASVVQARPGGRVVLLASDTQIDAVRLELNRQHSVMLEAIRFITLPNGCKKSDSPSKNRSTSSSVLKIFYAILDQIRVIRTARKCGAEVIILLSGDGPEVLSFKIASLVRFFTGTVVFVGHNPTRPRSRRWLGRFLKPSQVSAARLTALCTCKYLVLHGNVIENIRKEIPGANLDNFSSFSYPIIVDGSSDNDIAHRLRHCSPITMRLVSPSHKGVEEFCRLAASFQADPRFAQFGGKLRLGVVGGMSRARYESFGAKLVACGVSDFQPTPGWISNEEYDQALRQTHFAIHYYDKGVFDTRFSSAALDTLAYRIPGIFIRTGYSEYLFSQDGSPGWLVESDEHAIDAMYEICEKFCHEYYYRRVAELDRCRRVFSVNRSADEISKILPLLSTQECNRAP